MTGSFREYMAKRGLAQQPSAPPRENPPASALDQPLRVTFFVNHGAATKSESTTTLRELTATILDTRAPAKDQLPWLKLATFGGQRSAGGSLRNNANVVEIHGIEADYDGEQITLDRARQVLSQAGLAAVLYTSPSHTVAAPRWRVLCPTSRPLPPAERGGLVARLNGLFVGALAGESFTLSQSYYFGAVQGHEASHEVALIEGRPIDLADDLEAGAIGRAPKEAPAAAPMPRQSILSAGASPLGREVLQERCGQIRNAFDGGKHQAVNEAGFAVGGIVAAGHLLEGEAWAALRDALAAILPRCRDPRAAEKTLARAFREGMGRPQDVEPPEELQPLAPAVLTLTRIAQERAAAARGAPVPRPGPLPVASGLMDVSGALRLFVDHCQRTAISPQPFLALAAGICMIGAVAGRRYRTGTDLRTNVYAVGVADSGAGKDHARKQIRRCLHAADLSRYLGGSDIASGSGLRTALLRHPSMLFQIDEFGDWLRDVLGDRASSHRRQIATMLKELYSSANIPWEGIEYADQSRQGRPREDIYQPNACLFGTTTPGQFWGALAAGSLHDGLMARMLLFVSPCSYPDEQEPELLDPSPDLIAALQAIAAGPGAETGNLSGLMLPSVPPEPLTVPETPDAAAARRDLRRHQLAQQRVAEGTYVTAIAGRLAENAMKLALIRAVAGNPASPTITGEDVAWGRALSQHCIDTLLRDASRHVAESDYERKVNRALEIIRAHGPVTQRDLFRRGWKLPERERQEIIRNLVDAGLVLAIEDAREGPGRRAVRFAAVTE
jgi:Protein of unknown function (DUF3987)